MADAAKVAVSAILMRRDDEQANLMHHITL